MKSEILNPEQKTPFPKLMIAQNGLLVLMTDSEKGIVALQGEASCHKIGTYREDWAMDGFADFKGSVTLSNE